MNARRGLDVAWVVSRAVILTLPPYISDVFYYHWLAQSTLGGALPYTAQLPVEYPPLALVPLVVAGGVVRTLTGALELEPFRHVLHAVLLAFDLWTFRLLRRGVAPWLTLAWLVGSASLGYLLLERLDGLVGWSLVMGLVLGARDARAGALAGLTLAGGALVKFVPALAVPAVVLDAAVAGRWRGAVAMVVAATAAVVVGVAPVVALSGSLPFLTFHGERGIQVESVWASLLYLRGVLGLSIDSSHGAQHLAGAGVAEVLAISSAVLAIGLAVAVALPALRRADPALGAFLAVLTFTVLNRVQSPQYWVAVLPCAVVAAAAAGGRGGAAIAWLATAVCVLTGALFARYWELPAFGGTAIALLGVRNALELVLLGVSLRAVLTARTTAPSPTPGPG